MSEKKRLRVLFSGSVQGVGMRATVRQLAEGFVVTGWVKNLSEGTVQMEAQGTEEEVENLLSAIQHAMRANIKGIQRNWVGILEGEFTFSIEYR